MSNTSVVIDSNSPSSAGRGRSFRMAPLWVLLITVLAGVLRTLCLTSQGITLDESFSIFLGRTTYSNFVHLVWSSEFNMVLYYVLLRLWMNLGHSEFVIRMLGVLFATATVPVVYFLGKRLFDERTALLAALLLAMHPSHLMLAQRARSYPLVILLVSMASLCFVLALQKPTRAIWMAYAAFSAASIYSHFFAVLVIAAQMVSLLFILRRPPPWKLALPALAFLAVLLLPMAAFFLHHGDTSHVAWVPDLSLQQVLWVLYSLTLSKGRSLAYIVAWGLAAWAAFRASSPDSRWPYQFTFTWLLVPPAVIIAASLYQPLLVERYLAICIPASMLLAAAGIIQLSRWTRAAAIGLLALILLYSASGIRFYERHPEFAEGWRGASTYVLAHVQAGDVVIVGGLAGLSFDYYREIDKVGLPSFARLESVATSLPSPPPQNVWLIGDTRFNPNWKGAVPGAGQAEVQAFAVAHQRDYCPLPTHAEMDGVRAWQFRRCISSSEPIH
jgi:mannosyltransferase